MMKTEYIENGGFLQRDSVEHKEYAEACSTENQEIKESLYSENPIVRMFAVLDRRVGKRTLTKVKETIEEQPLWLKQFYQLRLAAEGI